MGDVLIDAPIVRLVAAAGAEDGRGHLGRALALAEALRDRGFRPFLELRRGVLSKGQEVLARELRMGAGLLVAPSMTIVDLPDPNETLLEPSTPLAVFDDRESFRGEAAIVIQPSLPTWSGPRAARVGRVLAGYDYVPIREAVRRRGETTANLPADPYVVLCFGGSDPHDVTARVAPALLDLPSTRAVVILGADYRGSLDRNGLDERLEVRRDPADFIELMADSALVVASAGMLKFELAVLGRPMILVAVVDDQLPVAPTFAATGAARYLGDGRRVRPADLRAAVVALLGDDTARATLGERGRSVVDGRGGERIADAVAQVMGTR